MASLIAMNGFLYGTTSRRAKRGDSGTVFVVDTSGLEKVLYNFTGGTDGAYPEAALTKVNDILYGTTEGGGTEGYGTIFNVTAAGKERALYSFQGGTDGANPVTKLSNLNGTLYGTTSSGGYACGCGTVFTVTAAGKEHVLYRFESGRDGAYPGAYLTLAKGLLYGTTGAGGGSGCSDHGCGTVFSISTAGKERVLYRFRGGSDGANPVAGLTKLNGLLYGTTSPGDNNAGTVFSITTGGKMRVLYAFPGGSDGANPDGHLTNLNGVLYGTTSSGGLSRCGYHHSSAWCGTVFSVTTEGKVIVLYQFQGGNDGSYPVGLFPLGGTLYGTTGAGGQYGQGTVFALTP